MCTVLWEKMSKNMSFLIHFWQKYHVSGMLYSGIDHPRRIIKITCRNSLASACCLANVLSDVVFDRCIEPVVWEHVGMVVCFFVAQACGHDVFRIFPGCKRGQACVRCGRDVGKRDLTSVGFNYALAYIHPCHLLHSLHWKNPSSWEPLKYYLHQSLKRLNA